MPIPFLALVTLSAGYLVQTAASVDAMLKTYTGTLKTMLAICDADTNPVLHKDAVFLRKYIPYINRQGSNVVKKDLSHSPVVKDSKLKDKRRIREIEDYVFCLNAARNMNSKYVLALEDDVLPEGDMLKVLEHTLAQRLYYRQSGYRDALENVAFLKLYYPQRWQGFAREKLRLAELLCVGLVGGMVFARSFAMFWRYYSGSRVKMSVLRYLFWIATTVSMAQITDRVELLELRRVSPWTYKFGPSPACCTQAMLYPTTVLPDLTQFLLVNNSLNKDLAIYDFTLRSDKMHGYQIEPNLFKHIGMHTSLSAFKSSKDPREFLFDMPFYLGISPLRKLNHCSKTEMH